MKKFIIIIILAFNISAVFSQQNWATINLLENLNINTIKEVIPIVNNENGYFVTIFKIDDGYKCYLLNKEQQVEKFLNISVDSKKLDLMIGSAFENNRYALFFTNTSGSKYSCLTLDFDKNNSELVEDLNIDFKGEKLIAYAEQKADFYALSIVKNSSILKLYDFSLDGQINSKTYDLSHENFETDNQLPLTLYAVLFGKHSDGTVETIDPSIPNTLENTTAYTKIYLDAEGLKLSNNTFKKTTYLIELNFKDNAPKLSRIENPKFDKKSLRANSNSFVLDDKIFDVYSTADEIVFNVHDFKTNTLIKTFNIIPGDSIAFKNSAIIHEVVNTNSYRDLEKTTRFVRKVNNSNIGIAVYPFEDNYMLTVGSSEKIQSGEFAIIGGILGGMVGAALFSAFDQYNKTQSTRIECLFDKNFNHIEGDIPKNGFDLINAHIKENNLKRAKLQTVFKYQDTYIWGLYTEHGGFYRFFQFDGI